MHRRAVRVRLRRIATFGALAAVALGPSTASADAARSRPLTFGSSERQPPASESEYRPPVDAPIADPFRAPSGPYGPGNRGIEYATPSGTQIRSIGPGVVLFAGQVGGQLFVTIRHADGLRSSYSWLASIGVAVGQQVAASEVLGTSAERFHLGVRMPDGTYIDPASLFGDERPRHAVLDDAYLAENSS